MGSARSLDPCQSRGNPREMQEAGRVRQRMLWVLISSGSSVSEVMVTAEGGNSTGRSRLFRERKGLQELGSLEQRSSSKRQWARGQVGWTGKTGALSCWEFGG